LFGGSGARIADQASASSVTLVTRQRTLSGREFLAGESALREGLLRVGLAAAAAQRRRLSGTTFIGVTGSAGKTVTKTLIAEVLGAERPGTSTPGNANRLSSVGRTILRTGHDDAFCVAEVATWEPGGTARIARLLQPHVGVVTRIGLDHYKVFRTLEAVAAEKRALIAALPDTGIAVLNADDPHVIAMAEGFQGRVISFGESPEATLRAENVRSSWPDRLTFTLRIDGRSLAVSTRLYGKHSATGVLAALGVAVALEIPLERALETVARCEPVTGRMSPAVDGEVAFIRDDKKAPAWSLEALLDFIADARAARKILVVGTISDYAGSSSAVYVRTARRALDVADEVIFVGPNAHTVRRIQPEGTTLLAFDTVREAAAHLRATLRDGDLVVVKGSNSADHLVRVLLDRTQRVRCWRDACHRTAFCDACKLLDVPGAS
jgi:UDP-N-acetylmuramoyl-tripeptide--D-alanyl-D-alanine ligase